MQVPEGIDKKEYQKGIADETKEHGKLLGNDPKKIASVALAHLKKNPHYYSIVEKALKEKGYEK